MAILGDDPVATAAAALGVARAQARRRRVFLTDLLGDGSPLAELVPGGDHHGVSDMVRYGVSLGHAAQMVPGMPNLFVVPGGAESPLTDDVLGAEWWSLLFEQVRRSGALVLLAAPSIVPSIDRLVARTDGVLLVGEGVAAAGGKILGEVLAPSALRPAVPSPAASAAPAPRTARRRWLAPVLALALLAAGAAVLYPRWGEVAEFANARLGTAPPPDSQVAPTAAVPVVPVAGDADFAVQLLFLNSAQDANDILARATDSLPAATFAIVRPASDSVNWYRFVVGAFPDSDAAESFLGSARARGLVGAGAGTVVHTPYALLLDSAQSEAVAAVRRAAYQGRGIPAYSLRDSAGSWRIYAGAFTSADDGALLKRQLDSLNIESVLAKRTGSGS